MSEMSGNWVYFSDESPTATPLRDEPRTAGELVPAATQQCVLAVAMHLEGRSEDAIRQCHRGIERGEHLLELYGTLAQIQFECNRFYESAQAYQKQLLLEPKHPTAWYNLGLCQERTGKWKDAADSFRKALDSETTREAAVLGLGVSMLHLDQFDHALVLLDDYLGPNPKNQTALWGKAVALHKLKRYDEATELYDQVRLVPANKPDLLTNRVALHIACRNFAAARRCALELLELRVVSRPALEALATIAFEEHDFKSAAQHCGQLAQVAPSYEAWFNLGFAQHRTGELSAAAQAYREAAELKPNAEPAYANLGTVYHEEGKLPEARAAYERALRLGPDRIATLWNLGLLLEQLGQGLEAERHYAKVAGHQPDWEEPWLRIGHLRMTRSDWAGAIQAWQKALAVRPECVDARFNLALSQWRIGESSAAREQFHKMEAEEIAVPEVTRALLILAMDRREALRALEYYQKAHALDAVSPELTYNVALLLQESDEAEQAALLYQEALKQRPTFVEALVNLGYACQSLGKTAEAKTCWERARRQDLQLTDHYLAQQLQ